MLTETQIAYLAGILDGEGQVSVTRQKRTDAKRKRDYGLRTEVRVSQRRRVLLSTILGWIGEENGTIGPTGLGGKFFQLRFKAEWLREHLPLIAPFLILKRRQAEIVIEFLGQPARVGRNGVGDEAWAKRDALRAECHALNMDRTNALT